MRAITIFLFGLLLFSMGFADTYKYIVNPYTQKMDAVTKSFENLTINNSLIVNGSITALGNMTATWFKGLFNWTEDSPYLAFNGGLLSFNETKLSSTIGAVTSPLYVNKSGDTINGNLIINGNLTVVQQITPVNVSSVNANGSIIPLIDNFFTIGNSTNKWAAGYATNLYGNLNASYVQNEYWVDVSGDTMTGDLSLGTNNLTAGNIFANLNSSYIQDEFWVNASGDTMTGNLDMGTSNLTAGNAFANVNASYVQNEYWANTTGDTFTGNITLGSGVCFVWSGGGVICGAP